MTNPRYSFLPQARQDIIESALYIAEDNPPAAERFLDAVESACGLLATMQEMGTQMDFSHTALKGMRMWPIKGFARYLIFYHPIDDGIEVVRVVHGARDLPTLFAE